jgi:hypothetical protein
MTIGRIATFTCAGFALGAALAGVGLRVRRLDPGSEAPLAEALGRGRTRPGCIVAPEVAARAAIVDGMAKEAERLFAANLRAHFLPPGNLPDRFRGEAIEQTLRSAIRTAGIQAEVLGTDCREYPCVTTARVRSAEEMQKIKDQFFDQATYAGDMKQLARANADDPTEYRFGATIYPTSDPRQDEIFAALTRRLGVARLGPGSLRPEAPSHPPATIGASTAGRQPAQQQP